MKRKLIKIFSMIFIILLILNASYITCEADEFTVTPSLYKPTADSSNIPKIAQVIFKIMKTVGIGASVICLIVIGTKYMMASVENRAKYKEVMIPYIVGALLVGAIPTLVEKAANLIAGW